MSTSGTVTLAGHSDDLVEIKAPGVHDEINSDPVHFRFSDGTRLTFEWCPEGHEGYGWKATVHQTGTATVDITAATDPEGDWPEYTDQVTVGPVTWIEHIDSPDTDDDMAPVQLWTIG
jgi:hypothetical protein